MNLAPRTTKAKQAIFNRNSKSQTQKLPWAHSAQSGWSSQISQISLWFSAKWSLSIVPWESREGFCMAELLREFGLCSRADFGYSMVPMSRLW